MKATNFDNLLRTAVIAAGACIAAPTALAVPPAQETFTVDIVGFPIGDCGTFELWNDFVVEGHVIAHFDEEGNVAFINVHHAFSESIYYNAEDPAMFLVGGVPGEGDNLRIDVTSDPPTQAVAGLTFTVILPGHGVIFHEAGRLITDLESESFEITFQAGPKDFIEQDIAALCAAVVG